MAKREIYFSNQLEELIKLFKKNLRSESDHVFDKKLLIIPHLGLKTYIMQNLAKDPSFQIAAGIEVTNLAQGYAKITKKNLWSRKELSFFLQHEIIPLIEQEEELQRYFQKENRERRIGPFCDVLAKYFLQYAIFGKKTLPAWQETLWKKWDINYQLPLPKKTNWKIHLLGFSFIPKLYFDFFIKTEAAFYLFSPCEIFWGDFYTEKERSYLRKKVSMQQLDFFEESFEDQNPLLTSWGKVGRMFHLAIEERNLLTQEAYIPSEESHSLAQLQRDILSGSVSKPSSDDSISFVSAFSLQRELEVCKDQILRLCDQKKIEPKEIQVYAPDISLYAPYIHAIFSDIPYGISEIPLDLVDPMTKSFLQMLDLPKKRFALEDVLQLLGKLSKFHLDLSLARKWCEQSAIRWGSSEKKRELFYLRNFTKQQISFNTSIGSWDFGLKQLLLGLASYKGIQCINPAEMVEFNKLFHLFHSLDDDLTPLYDGTCWTIPTWLRYLACLFETYFEIDPSHELYKEFLKMAANLDHLDRETVPYEGIERVLSSTIHMTFQPPHLQAVRFGSLSEGCLQSSKAILLLGIQEGAFPRTEEKNSLYGGVVDFCPKRIDTDRYLFLQALCFAKEFFSVSYIRDSQDEIPHQVVELLSVIDEAKVIHHPKNAHDADYFGGKLTSYNERAYRIAKEQKRKEKNPPLILSFQEPISLSILPLQTMEIQTRKLFKFAKHPLRYFFHEVLGIYPKTNRSEYLLDPLIKHKLVLEALHRPLDEVIRENEANLPVHLLQPLAIEQIEQEAEEYKTAIQQFGLKEIQTKKVAIDIGPITVHGKIDFFTDKGLLVKGKNQLEDKIKYWPQALIMKRFDLPIIFSKDGSMFSPDASFEDYLAYFQLAHVHPSPCIPSLAKAIFQRTLKKKFKQVEDEIFDYLLFRDPFLNPEMIEKNWGDLLETIFGGILANV